MRWAVLAFVFVGCNAEIPIAAYRCDVAIEDVAPTSAYPGDEVSLTGTPFTTSWDTAVFVGGARATVEDVNRDTCDECDACIDAAACLVCADCDACDALCNGCVERTTFIVPDLPAGKASVRVLNSHGESDPATLVVLAKVIDTGATDDSGGDSGKKDDSGTK